MCPAKLGSQASVIDLKQTPWPGSRIHDKLIAPRCRCHLGNSQTTQACSIACRTHTCCAPSAPAQRQLFSFQIAILRASWRSKSSKSHAMPLSFTLHCKLFLSFPLSIPFFLSSYFSMPFFSLYLVLSLIRTKEELRA